MRSDGKSDRSRQVPAVVTTSQLGAALDAFARGDLAGAVACFAEGATYREARREPIRGRDAIAAHFERFSAAAAAWRFEVDDVIRDGARACVVFRFTLEGTGTSRSERAGCAIVRIDQRGQIAEWREYDG